MPPFHSVHSCVNAMKGEEAELKSLWNVTVKAMRILESSNES